MNVWTIVCMWKRDRKSLHYSQIWTGSCSIPGPHEDCEWAAETTDELFISWQTLLDVTAASQHTATSCWMSVVLMRLHTLNRLSTIQTYNLPWWSLIVPLHNREVSAADDYSISLKWVKALMTDYKIKAESMKFKNNIQVNFFLIFWSRCVQDPHGLELWFGLRQLRNVSVSLAAKRSTGSAASHHLLLRALCLKAAAFWLKRSVRAAGVNWNQTMSCGFKTLWSIKNGRDLRGFIWSSSNIRYWLVHH